MNCASLGQFITLHPGGTATWTEICNKLEPGGYYAEVV